MKTLKEKIEDRLEIIEYLIEQSKKINEYHNEQIINLKKQLAALKENKEYLLCENCGIDVELTPLGECLRCGADLRSC